MAEFSAHATELISLARNKAFGFWWAAGGIGAAALLYGAVDSSSKVLAFELGRSREFAEKAKNIALTTVTIVTVAITAVLLGLYFFPEFSVEFDLKVSGLATLAFVSSIWTIFLLRRTSIAARASSLQATPPVTAWRNYILGLTWRAATLIALYMHLGKFLFSYFAPVR